MGLMQRLAEKRAATNTSQGVKDDGTLFNKKNALKTCKPGYKKVNGKCVKK
tara:strand:- start:44 stop:196 length:153 start_codon:yes stop_codon:yes gene_type:complete